MREQDVCLELLLDWLGDGGGRRFEIERTEEPAPGVLAAIATDGAQRLAAEVHPLLAPTRNDAWASNRERLEGEIAAGLTGGYALWLPPGAAPPARGAGGGGALRAGGGGGGGAGVGDGLGARRRYRERGPVGGD